MQDLIPDRATVPPPRLEELTSARRYRRMLVTAVLSVTAVGSLEAIVPRVRGTAYFTGRHEFLIDPEDPLRDGFLLR